MAVFSLTEAILLLVFLQSNLHHCPKKLQQRRLMDGHLVAIQKSGDVYLYPIYTARQSIGSRFKMSTTGLYKLCCLDLKRLEFNSQMLFAATKHDYIKEKLLELVSHE